MFAPGSSGALAAGAALWALPAALFVSGVLPANAPGLALVGVVAALWVFFVVFFRDPQRRPGTGIVAPADGRVREVVQEGGLWRVSVFMNVTDVHVNRFPLDGRVLERQDSGRGFRPAYAVGASHNVQRRYRLESAVGPVEVVQMTGLLARRLVSFVGPGDERKKGDRLGMIVLGSRVDLLFAAERARPTVRVGDRTRAGETTVAVEVP